MVITTRGIVAMLGAVAFVAFVSLQAVSAQAPNPSAPAAQAPAAPAPAQAGAQKSETAKGELKSVDPAKKTLTLAAEGGASQMFQYTDTTKVSGAQGGVEGLATMSGRQVTIQYMTKGADRIATSIEVATK
jgi:hypothetical protein